MILCHEKIYYFVFRIGKRFSNSAPSKPSLYPFNLPYHSSVAKLSPPNIGGGEQVYRRPPTLQERFPLFAHLAASGSHGHPLASASTSHNHQHLSHPNDRLPLSHHDRQSLYHDHMLARPPIGIMFVS